MEVSKQEARLIETCLRHWEAQGHLDPATAEKLKASYKVKEANRISFDWKNLSLIAFFFSIMCIFLSTALFISDKWLMTVMDALLDTSDQLKALAFFLLSVLLYYWAYVRKKKYTGGVYSNEALFMLGAVAVSFSLTYLSFALHLEEGDFPLLILMATFIFGATGILLHSFLNWYLALFAFTLWFGTETAYLSDWDTHFWGMNYPMRYVFFGALLLGMSRLFQRFEQTRPYVKSTFVTGLTGLLFSFWLLSVFGNYGDWDAWSVVAQWRFIFWAVVLGLASVGAIYYGLKKGKRSAREIGIAFLLLNIYTRYFEYFWDSLHKVAFFIILAASFWLIGKKAESVWHLREKKLVEEDQT